MDTETGIRTDTTAYKGKQERSVSIGFAGDLELQEPDNSPERHQVNSNYKRMEAAEQLR